MKNSESMNNKENYGRGLKVLTKNKGCYPSMQSAVQENPPLEEMKMYEHHLLDES